MVVVVSSARAKKAWNTELLTVPAGNVAKTKRLELSRFKGHFMLEQTTFELRTLELRLSFWKGDGKEKD